MSNPIILSFDVGIINLAYCLFTRENNEYKIIDWEIINLTDREFTKCKCGLKASFINNNEYYCKVHIKKCEILKSFEELFLHNCENKCCHLVKGNYCGRKSTYNYDNQYYCVTHAKNKYKLLQTLYKNKPFKNKSVSSLNFDDTRLKLLQTLDSKKELFKADIVLIENQPALKNMVMKSIANGIYDFYTMRGIMDKEITKSNITKVKFLCPSNKLKIVNDGETKKITLLKSNNIESKTYKLTKSLGIKYTNELIAHLPEWIEYLNKQKKQDDLCDAYLQGCYYYEKNYC